MATSGRDVNVRDVYDLAHEIAEEFESIVDSFDQIDIRPFVRKLIRVFQILEETVKKIDALEKDNLELRNKNFQLLNEKTAQEQKNLQLKEAFDEIEESYIKEATFLRSIIDKLNAQNRLLKTNIQHEDSEGLHFEQRIQDQENQILRLKSSLKRKSNELDYQLDLVEKLNSKLDVATGHNHSLDERLVAVQCLLDARNFEKNAAQRKLEEQQAKILSLENNFSYMKKSLLEKQECEAETPYSNSNFESALQQSQGLHEKNVTLQQELMLLKNENKKFRDRLTLFEEENNATGSKSVIHSIFRLFLGNVYIKPQLW